MEDKTLLTILYNHYSFRNMERILEKSHDIKKKNILILKGGKEAYDMFGSCFLKLFTLLKNKENKKNMKNAFGS